MEIGEALLKEIGYFVETIKERYDVTQEAAEALLIKALNEDHVSDYIHESAYWNYLLDDIKDGFK